MFFNLVSFSAQFVCLFIEKLVRALNWSQTSLSFVCLFAELCERGIILEFRIKGFFQVLFIVVKGLHDFVQGARIDTSSSQICLHSLVTEFLELSIKGSQFVLCLFMVKLRFIDFSLSISKSVIKS